MSRERERDKKNFQIDKNGDKKKSSFILRIIKEFFLRDFFLHCHLNIYEWKLNYLQYSDDMNKIKSFIRVQNIQKQFKDFIS